MIDSALVMFDRMDAAFARGQSIEGEVVIYAQESWEARYCQVLLGWSTTGRGEEDSRTIETIDLYQKGEAVPKEARKRFAFRAPELPWSYSGNLIKIHWFVGVYARHGLSAEVNNEAPLEIHPRHGATAPSVAPPE